MPQYKVKEVTPKGQITIPAAIRRALGIKDGDKVMFIRQEGKVVMMNASPDAFPEAQQAFWTRLKIPDLKMSRMP